VPTSPRESGVILIVQLNRWHAIWFYANGDVDVSNTYKELFEPVPGWDIHE